MAIGILLGTILLWWSGANAQSSCTSVIISLSPCLNYVTGNSSTPTTSCCSQLASVVSSQPQCLCTVLNNNGSSSSLGLTINQTRALELPAACNVQTPPLSECNKAISPAAATSPAESPTATPASGGGSKAVPSTSGSSSYANPFTTLFIFGSVVLALVASYATTTLTTF